MLCVWGGGSFVAFVLNISFHLNCPWFLCCGAKKYARHVWPLSPSYRGGSGLTVLLCCQWQPVVTSAHRKRSWVEGEGEIPLFCNHCFFSVWVQAWLMPTGHTFWQGPGMTWSNAMAPSMTASSGTFIRILWLVLLWLCLPLMHGCRSLQRANLIKGWAGGSDPQSWWKKSKQYQSGKPSRHGQEDSSVCKLQVQFVTQRNVDVLEQGLSWCK